MGVVAASVGSESVDHSPHNLCPERSQSTRNRAHRHHRRRRCQKVCLRYTEPPRARPYTTPRSLGCLLPDSHCYTTWAAGKAEGAREAEAAVVVAKAEADAKVTAARAEAEATKAAANADADAAVAVAMTVAATAATTTVLKRHRLATVNGILRR